MKRGAARITITGRGSTIDGAIQDVHRQFDAADPGGGWLEMEADFRIEPVAKGHVHVFATVYYESA